MKEEDFQKGTLNLDTLKQQYTTKINTYMEDAKVSENEGSRLSEYSIKIPDINIDDIKTGLMDSMTFMVRVTDTKMQNNKVVRKSFIMISFTQCA